MDALHLAFALLALVSVSFAALNLYVALFGPDVAYLVKQRPNVALDSDAFCSLLATLTDAQPHHTNTVEVLTNGGSFYEAELAAIALAKQTINLEAYIFHPGEIASRYVHALAERARAGVEVKLILDYIGCLSTRMSYFRELTDAGGRVEWYHPLRPSLLLQMNNRTHRELLILDATVGFIGGAGVADQWFKDVKADKRWRDTVFRVTGPAMASLQATFADNWLRVSGEILTGSEYFSFAPTDGNTMGFVVNSAPAAGSARSRILFQTLISCACRRIYITTPYFLPDRSARQSLVEAVAQRNVDVKILAPGKHADHLLTRTSSRHLYGPLLRGGAEIYEYKPAMIHAKVMIVDDLWCVVGSTNFDHRSFGINDEVNLVLQDASIAARLTADFHNDLEQSHKVTYEEWQQRKLAHFVDWFGSMIQRQE